MIPPAHVGGLPLEEFLPAVASTGASLLAVRAWLNLGHRRLRRRDPGK